MIINDIATGVRHKVYIKHWHPEIYKIIFDNRSISISKSVLHEIIEVINSIAVEDPYDYEMSPTNRGEAHMCACDLCELLEFMGYTAVFSNVYRSGEYWEFKLHLNDKNTLVKFKGQHLRETAVDIVDNIFGVNMSWFKSND